MNGGFASRSAAELTPPPRRATSPVVQAPEATRAPLRGTRERLQTAFGVATAVTTRDRIANRARADEPTPTAPVIDLATRRRPDTAPPPPADAPRARVVLLHPARGPPEAAAPLAPTDTATANRSASVAPVPTEDALAHAPTTPATPVGARARPVTAITESAATHTPSARDADTAARAATDRPTHGGTSATGRGTATAFLQVAVGHAAGEAKTGEPAKAGTGAGRGNGAVARRETAHEEGGVGGSKADTDPARGGAEGGARAGEDGGGAGRRASGEVAGFKRNGGAGGVGGEAGAIAGSERAGAVIGAATGGPLGGAGAGEPVATPGSTGAVAPGGMTARAPETAGAGAPKAATKTDVVGPVGAAVTAGAAPGAGGAAVVVAPVAETGADPDSRPGFRAMRRSVRRSVRQAKAHQPGVLGARTAQAASRPDPQKDQQRQVDDVHSIGMEGARPGTFNAAAFTASVQATVKAMAPPRTLEAADDFEQSHQGEEDKASASIRKIVSGGQSDAEHDIREKKDNPPKASDFTPKEARTPMVNDRLGPAPADPRADLAMPEPIPQAAIDLGLGPKLLDERMAKANLTTQQLHEGNEPSFDSALQARQEVIDHTQQDPAAYREREEVVLEQGRNGAKADAAAQLAAVHSARQNTLAGVLVKKADTKTRDEALRNQINEKVVGFHTATKDDVTALLKTLDGDVEKMFDEGEKQARHTFEVYVSAKMAIWKDKRYGGWFGGGYWLKDKIFSLPDDVNKFYEDGRKGYLDDMDALVERIATFIGITLGIAHLRILFGRLQVKAYVESLPRDTQALGAEVATDLDGRFDQLAADVDAKADELVTVVAKRYVDARTELDSRIKELQEENKGLLEKAIDAIVGVIKTIYELGKLLLRVLLKAASAIGDIVAHPIRFFGNLIDAIGGGLDRFVDRIGVHLEESLLDVLFGELGHAGITLPKQLDFAGIVDLVLQILRLRYADFRDRFVRRFGEPAVLRMEQTVDVFKTLARDGIAGLWSKIQEKLSDLYDLVIGKLKEYIVERVIKAGIGYIASLLTPVGAFIKACQGIYQLVMFVVEKAKQIADFVDAVLDSIAAIAAGNVGAAIEKIDAALGGALKLAIGFLAKLANLGALSEKIRSIVEAVRAPIRRVVEAVINGAAEAFAPAFAFVAAKGRTAREALRGKRAEAAPVLQDDEPALVIDEPFLEEGEEHELFTGEDGEQLMVASFTPTPLSKIVDASGQLARLEHDYLIAHKAWRAAVDAHAANPAARSGRTQLRRRVRLIVGRIVGVLRRMGKSGSPGASAPGIGEIGLHGEKGSSIRSGPVAWWLESEHLLPFAIGKTLWAAIGRLTPERGSRLDKEQTTIMLYYEASRFKTSRHDVGAINDFAPTHAAKIANAADKYERALNTRGRARKSSDAAFLAVYNKVKNEVGKIKRTAVAATKRAVRDEHTLVFRGQTMGDRRNEKSPLPTDDRIDAAADLQYYDVINLAEDEIRQGGIEP